MEQFLHVEASSGILLLAMADSQPTRERLLACLELIGNGRSLPDDVVTDLAPARLIQREMKTEFPYSTQAMTELCARCSFNSRRAPP